MSDFAQHLDKEVEKGQEESVEQDGKDSNAQKKSKPSKLSRDSLFSYFKNIKIEKGSLFSLGSFLKGIAACLVIFSILIGAAWFQADKTDQAVQEKLASKTAIVERDYRTIYKMSDTQPVLRMASAHEDNAHDKAQTHSPKVKTREHKLEPVSGKDKMPALVVGEGGLVPAPVPGLYESVAAGTLPIPRGEDQLTPFNAYKRAFKKDHSKPTLSIIIGDVGLFTQATKDIIKDFPAEVSLVFSSYSNNLKQQTKEARNGGHEVWLTLPMETKTFPLDDPGPSTLLLNTSVEQNKNRLTSVLASTQGYVGFISQKDHAFKSGGSEASPAIQEIFSRGLAILDSNTFSASFIHSFAEMNDYPHAKNDFWLDNDLSTAALEKQMNEMIEYGEARGRVTLMLRPYPASLKLLKEFLDSGALNVFQLAPASAQVTYGS